MHHVKDRFHLVESYHFCFVWNRQFIKPSHSRHVRQPTAMHNRRHDVIHWLRQRRAKRANAARAVVDAQPVTPLASTHDLDRTVNGVVADEWRRTNVELTVKQAASFVVVESLC